MKKKESKTKSTEHQENTNPSLLIASVVGSTHKLTESQIEHQMEMDDEENSLWMDDEEHEILGYECMDCGNIQEQESGFGCDKCMGHCLEPWYS